MNHRAVIDVENVSLTVVVRQAALLVILGRRENSVTYRNEHWSRLSPGRSCKARRLREDISGIVPNDSTNY